MVAPAAAASAEHPVDIGDAALVHGDGDPAEGAVDGVAGVGGEIGAPEQSESDHGQMVERDLVVHGVWVSSQALLEETPGVREIVDAKGDEADALVHDAHPTSARLRTHVLLYAGRGRRVVRNTAQMWTGKGLRNNKARPTRRMRPRCRKRRSVRGVQRDIGLLCTALEHAVTESRIVDQLDAGVRQLGCPISLCM